MCWFIAGAFEDRKTDPFSAISQAFSSYCTQLLNSRNDKSELRREAAGIQRVVGKEARVLTDMVRQLVHIIGENSYQPEAYAAYNATASNNSATTTTNYPVNSHSSNQIKFLFQSAVEVICGGQIPLIFLDDLQRADASSLRSSICERRIYLL